jgi:predicted PurR-regulated permease PerM
LDGYLIYPQTVGRSLRMDTFLVLLSLMAGGAVGGIVGMVVATPLLALFIEWMGLLRAQLRSSRVI